MDDFDFDFDFEGNDLYDLGAFDFSNLDVGNLDFSNLDFEGPGGLVDLGSILDSVDLGGMDLSGFDIGSADDIYQGTDFGDDGAGTIVITGERQYPGFDIETADTVYAGSDLGTDPFEIDGLQGSREETGFDFSTADEVYQGATGVDPYEVDQATSRDETTALTPSVDPYEVDQTTSRTEDDATKTTDDEPCPPNSNKTTTYRDGSTLTLDCKGRVVGSTPATLNPDDPEDCPAGSEKTVTLADGSKNVYDCKGNLIRTIPPGGGSDVCPPNSDKTVVQADGSKIITDCKGNFKSYVPKGGTTTTTKTDDWTKWIALLGGLMGLLGQNKPSAPVGYQGGIPKYTATRGPSRSPTAGGRRPGGAGIGSLTGGVSFTPVGAAQGGLMGLAAGGQARPARYLAGGTDGMADKIQTSIDGKQPARLSHGEFVIPADVVSHLGNGNSDAGADVLYDMMAKVRKARTGNPKQGKQINPRKYTPV